MKEKTRDIVINGLLAHATIREASKATGISESTFYRYLKDDAFKKEYEEKRTQLLIDNCHKLQASMGKAIDELIKIIDDDGINPQTKLNAIDALLRHAYKQTEIIDILPRLEVLEKEM